MVKWVGSNGAKEGEDKLRPYIGGEFLVVDGIGEVGTIAPSNEGKTDEDVSF